MAFSPDGATLASINQMGAIKLWHLATLRELLAIDFPEAGMFLHFTSDQRHLAATTQKNSIRLFEAP